MEDRRKECYFLLSYVFCILQQPQYNLLCFYISRWINISISPASFSALSRLMSSWVSLTINTHKYASILLSLLPSMYGMAVRPCDWVHFLYWVHLCCCVYWNIEKMDRILNPCSPAISYLIIPLIVPRIVSTVPSEMLQWHRQTLRYAFHPALFLSFCPGSIWFLIYHRYQLRISGWINSAPYSDNLQARNHLQNIIRQVLCIAFYLLNLCVFPQMWFHPLRYSISIQLLS